METEPFEASEVIKDQQKADELDMDSLKVEQQVLEIES